MQVVILAAGLGSRLGNLTREVPKALIEVDGRTLLGHAIAFARRMAPTEIVAVGGFGYSLVADESRRQQWPVTLVENVEFRDGNLVSLFVARPHVRGDFLLMNVDHLYRPAIADLVRAPADDVTAMIDTDRTVGADDMKVARDADGRVGAISKTLDAWDAGYVGMMRVPEAALERYWSAADAVHRDQGRATHVEAVLARLARAGHPALCRDISGHGWLEVDTPSERAAAERVLASSPARWR